MGLTITEYPIYNGLAKLTNLYANVRDIRINKDNDKFIVECILHLYGTVVVTPADPDNNVDEVTRLERVNSLFYQKEYEADFLTKTWEDCYNLVKEKLTENGITWIDSI